MQRSDLVFSCLVVILSQLFTHTKYIFALPCYSAMSVNPSWFCFCLYKIDGSCALSGLKCTPLLTPDAHSAHCSVSHFKCKKSITHASLILSCICIVWSLRCWLCFEKELFLLANTTPARADTKHGVSTLFCGFSVSVSLYQLSQVNKSKSRWKMTFHMEEALIFSDQCAKDYLVLFQHRSITGTVIIIF